MIPLPDAPVDASGNSTTSLAARLQGNPAAVTDGAAHNVIAAQSTGIRIYLEDLVITNSHATQGTLVSITDGPGGTVLVQGYAAPAGGGFSWRGFRVGSGATALSVICGTSGANVIVSAGGYRGI